MLYFQKIYSDKYYINVCRSFCQSQAQDLLHDAILKIHEAKPKIDNEQQFKSYFYKTVKTCFLQQQTEENINIEELEIEQKTDDHYEIYHLLEEAPKNKEDFVTKEITKLYLSLGSYKKVSDKLNIPQRTICHIVNKFIKDARNKINY